MPLIEGERMLSAWLGTRARRVLSVVVVGAIGSLLTACDTTSVMLEGQVTHSGDGTSPAGVLVQAYSADAEEVVAETVTDSQGRYRFRESTLAAGTYRLQFSASVWWEDAAAWADATDVTATADDPATIDVALVPAVGSLTGTATAADETPVDGATVDVVSAINNTTVASVESDSDGTFEFAELPVGEYRVRVAADGMATTYSPASPTADGAETVEVVAGQTADHVDVLVPEAATLTGFFTNDGVPVVGDVFAVTRSSHEIHAVTTTEPEGGFTLEGLSPAEYLLAIVYNGQDDDRYVVVGADPGDPDSGNVYTPTAGGTLDVGEVDTWQTSLVSVTPDGSSPMYRNSGGASVGGDGRYVAFVSEAEDLVPGDTNGAEDVFVRDRETGSISLVSVAPEGESGNSSSGEPDVSRDGRYIVFVSEASDLVPGDTNGAEDVFVRDIVTDTTSLVSVGPDSEPGNGSSGEPEVSGGGRFIVFSSQASDLVPGDLSGTHVFLRDMDSGTTSLVSVDPDGLPAGASYDTVSPSLSDNGQYITFQSTEASLDPRDTNNSIDVFMRDMVAGTTSLVSLAPDGEADHGRSDLPSMSADGRFIAFQSAAGLVPGDPPGRHVYMRDMEAGVTSLVSVTPDGQVANNGSSRPSISANGQYIVFQSLASDLVTDGPGVTRGEPADIYVRDMEAGVTSLVSVTTDGEPRERSFAAAVSGDGRSVAFSSFESDLAPGDVNYARDVFVRDMGG